VPCTTPLNMTITLDDRPEIPLHPLDLTAEPLQDNQAEFCTGLIQTADSQLSNPSNDLGDIILGVPFLRNVYTVMAYIAPDANGSFTPVNGSNQTITPMLGLLSLTDPTIALEEFHTVRDLKQPISGGNSSGGSAGDSPSNSTINVGGKKLSVGIVVLIGILSFLGLCCVLFVAHWFLFRRTYRKVMSSAAHGDDFGVGKRSTATEEFMLTKTISSKDEKGSMGFFKSDLEDAALGVDLGDEKMLSDSSDDGMNVAVLEDGRVMSEVLRGGERESMASGDTTFVQYQQKINNPYPAREPDQLHSLPPSSPLLPSQTQQPLTSLDPHSVTRQSSSPTPDHEIEPQENLDEFGIEGNVRTSMAGIGTASRTSKTYLDSSFLRDINRNSGVITSAELGDNGPSFVFIPPRD